MPLGVRDAKALHWVSFVVAPCHCKEWPMVSRCDVCQFVHLVVHGHPPPSPEDMISGQLAQFWVTFVFGEKKSIYFSQIFFHHNFFFQFPFCAISDYFFHRPKKLLSSHPAVGEWRVGVGEKSNKNFGACDTHEPTIIQLPQWWSHDSRWCMIKTRGPCCNVVIDNCSKLGCPPLKWCCELYIARRAPSSEEAENVLVEHGGRGWVHHPKLTSRVVNEWVSGEGRGVFVRTVLNGLLSWAGRDYCSPRQSGLLCAFYPWEKGQMMMHNSVLRVELCCLWPRTCLVSA